MGIEASAEMQAVARNVLDENKKLRVMLNQKGVSNEEIDAFCMPAPSSPQDISSPLPSVTLAKLLSARRAVSSSPISRLQQPEEVPAPPPLPLPAPQLLTPLIKPSPYPRPVTSPASMPTKPETFPVVCIPHTPSGDTDEHCSSNHSFGHHIDPSSWLPYRNTSVLLTSYPDYTMKGDSAVKLENVLRYDCHLYRTQDPYGSNTYGVGHWPKPPSYLPSQATRNDNLAGDKCERGRIQEPEGGDT